MMAAVEKYSAFRLHLRPESKYQSHLRILPLSDVNSRRTAWRRSDYFYPEMIPEPDYSDDEDQHKDAKNKRKSGKKNVNKETAQGAEEKEEETGKDEAEVKLEKKVKSATVRAKPTGWNVKDTPAASPEVTDLNTDASTRLSDDGLVLPKKPVNPYLNSTQRQKLNKELKFSQKHGKNLNPRSELQIALDRFQEEKTKKNLAATQKTSLEKILEQQARKIEMQEQKETTKIPEWMSQLQRQQQPRSVADSETDEFYRVYARVVNQSHSDSNSSSKFSDNASQLSSTKSDDENDKSQP